MNKGSCAYRHYPGPKCNLSTLLTLEKCQKFEFKLMRFLTPVHYVVRVIRSQLTDGQVICHQRQQKDLDERLANVKDDLPTELSEVPGPDVVCGMLAADGSKLYRVQVLKAIDKDHFHVSIVNSVRKHWL